MKVNLIPIAQEPPLALTTDTLYSLTYLFCGMLQIVQGESWSIYAILQEEDWKALEKGFDTCEAIPLMCEYYV